MSRDAESAVVVEVGEFAETHRLRERSAALDSSPAFPVAEFRAMGAARLLGLTLPSALGGRGLPLPVVGRALRTLAGIGGTTFAKLSLQPEFSSVIAEHGSKELVERYFTPLLRGELLVGNQITEPGAGSDAGAIAAEATREGTNYIVTGEKSQAAFACDAAAAIVYVRVAGSAGPGGITALVIDQNSPGIERTTVGDLGERWMRRGTVRYDRVKVPLTNRVGEEGVAFDYLRSELRRERALLASIYLGVARDSWRSTVGYVHARRAFGRPLSSQEAVAFPLVEDQARLDAAELLVDEVLERLERGEATDADAARAKWLATETALAALDHAIQFHGGRGYSKELPHEQRWRDVRSGAIAHGTSEIMRLVGARALFPRAERRTDDAPRG